MKSQKRVHSKHLAYCLIFLCCAIALPAQAVLVTIDTGNFTGQWDMDFDGNFFSGSQIIDLDPGLHTLRPGTVGRIIFSVDTSGLVTLSSEFDGIAATGGQGTIAMLTIPVSVDPVGYNGDWDISRVRSQGPGPDVVYLVPGEYVNPSNVQGMEYRVSIGLGSSAFFMALRGDGSMTFRGEDGAAFDDAGTMKFRNADIIVHDRDGTFQPWLINQVTSLTNGDATVALVPGINYRFQSVVGAFFTVSEPCAVNPPTLNMAGSVFELSCGAPDQDEDGVPDTTDNCINVANPDQVDIDQDGFGDACDADDDNDGVLDLNDNCQMDPNPSQSDSDGDGLGDACDGDEDGDGVANESDLCPFSPPMLAVDAVGCTGVQRIARACKREEFVNHGKYVSCVAQATNEAANDGLILPNEKSQFVREAAKNK